MSETTVVDLGVVFRSLLARAKEEQHQAALRLDVEEVGRQAEVIEHLFGLLEHYTPSDLTKQVGESTI